MLQIENMLLCCSQKNGLDKSEYEDAFTPLLLLDQHSRKIKIAIADGATESSFSKEWANALVKKYSSSDFHGLDKGFFEDAFKEWELCVKTKKLSWFASEKLNDGAFAAFVGLNIDLESGIFKVEAIGDCCLFLIRNNQIIRSFPIDSYADFTNNPVLLSTKNIDSLKSFKSKNGKLLPGDMLILASDALAAFILKDRNSSPWDFFMQLVSKDSKKREKEALLSNWKELKKERKKIYPDADFDKFSNLVFKSHAEDNKLENWSFTNWIFKNWLAKQRDLRAIKNDDITLYLIKIKE